MSAILFLIDMVVWGVEALSLKLPRILPEHPTLKVEDNSTYPFYLTMDQLIMKYVILCAALGILQIAEGCIFLTTFFASPLGLIKIAFGVALAVVALFGAVITDGKLLHYLGEYLVYPALDVIKRPFGGLTFGSGLRDNPNVSRMLWGIDSPCLLGIGTIFTDIFTGLLEMCGEALAVLAIIPLGLSAGMIALSLLPFVSIALTDLFVTSLVLLPIVIALSFVFLLLVLYSRGRCTVLELYE
ncbi:MAG: hypothetical protein SVE93_00870 [Candidatus Thermoplasmatota archaeon]|nr:hypothetical protein [Candidatus Thermoplasmatota archaeon]